MNGYWKMTQNGLRAFVRDRAGLFWSFFFPLFFIVIFGSIFGAAGDRAKDMKFKVGLVNLDKSGVGAEVDRAFKAEKQLQLSTGAEADLTAKLHKGDLNAVVVVPAGLEGAFQTGVPNRVKVLFDPGSQQTSMMAVGQVQAVLGKLNFQLSGRPPVIVAAPEAAQPDPKEVGKVRQIDFLIPGILAMTITQLGLFTAIPIINMREKGIMKRLRATPLSRTALVGSHVTQRLIIGMVQTLLIIGVGVTLFKFHVLGSWAALIGIVALGVLAFICVGAVLSAIAKTQESGMSLVQLVNFPMMFLSGIFFPIEIMPSFFQPIVKAMPTTYLADGLRHIMVGSPSAHSLTTDVAILSAWLVGGLFVASRMFRWE